MHGYTATKEIPFRAVCETIRDYAFVATDLPVIVSLEVHTSHEQQATMVEIMESTWKGMLVDIPEDANDHTALPSPKELRNKILIKVKYAPPSAAKPGAPKSDVADETVAEVAESDAPLDASGKPAKKFKIIETLSRLGVYVRGYTFKDLQQPGEFQRLSTFWKFANRQTRGGNSHSYLLAV